MDRTLKKYKLTCRNWECGVLMPARKARIDEPEKSTKDKTKQVDMTVFHGAVPVPMEVPGAKYGQQKPWFFAEQ